MDSILVALEADPARTFTYSDVGFFAMWWGEQPPSVRARVRALVATKRLSFVNGGWVQHDEACSSWELMTDQLTRGHRWLNATFGPASIPTISWQVDPFGHSATHAALAGAAGFDAVYFARADFKDVARRVDKRALELVWRGEPSFGNTADLLAGTFLAGNYTAPWGFSFDWLQTDPPIIDNACAAPGVNNVASRVDAFVDAVRALAAPTRQGEQRQARAGQMVGAHVEEGAAGPATDGENDVLLTMGADFQYAAAGVYFKNMDKLIHWANADGRVNVFYSTPAAYTAARAASVPAWPLKTDDFFPFANDKDSYWVGYFSSRPGLKRAIARAGADLQAARQLAVLEGLSAAAPGAAAAPALARLAAALAPPRPPSPPSWSAALDALESVVAFGSHHDTITGTSKQAVTNAYLARLSRGVDGVEGLAGRALASLAGVGGDVEWCRALNASVCAPAARASAAGRAFTVLLYNSLASPRAEGVRIPIHVHTSSGSPPTWSVTGPGGVDVPSQILPISPGGRAAAASLVAAGGAAAADAPAHELAFLARLPPLGAAAFLVSPVEPSAPGAAAASASVGEAWAEARTTRSKLAARSAETGLAPPGVALTLAPTLAARGQAEEGEPAPPPTSATLAVDAATGALITLSSGARAGEETGAGAATAGMPTPAAAAALDGFDLAMGYYKAADDNGRGIAGGAYIMRTDASPLYTGFDLDRADNGAKAAPVRSASTGPVLSTYGITFSPYASATVRLWAGLPDAEVEWTVGPLPSTDRVGREVIISYTSSLVTGNGTLWTDANGRRNMRRVRDSRPTFLPNIEQGTASNFYPMTSIATLEGQATGGRDATPLALSLVTDRAQGVASRGDGSVDVLVHRRLFKDDWKGVAEPLNETECGCVPARSTADSVGYSDCGCGGVVATGTHTLVLAPAGAGGARARRDAAARAGRPLLVAIVDSGAEEAAPPPAAVSVLAPALAASGGLPPNVRLATLAPAGRPGAEDGRILIRLAHTYGAGEHPEALSKPATVDLNGLLAGVAWDDVTEVTLTASRPLGEAPKRIKWGVGEALDLSSAGRAQAAAVPAGAGSATPKVPLVCDSGCAGRPLPVTLGPMQVRTFLVTPANT